MLALINPSAEAEVQALMGFRESFVVTPPPMVGRKSSESPPAKRFVSFAPTRTVVYFSRQLDGSKIPSDAIAPLGLGDALAEEHEPLAEETHRRERGVYNFCMPVPPDQRVALLRDTCTEAAMAAAVQQNVQLLRELNDSRMRLILSGKRGACEDEDSDDDESNESSSHPPAKRVKLGDSSSSSSNSDSSGSGASALRRSRSLVPGGKCDACRRVMCLCVA